MLKKLIIVLMLLISIENCYAATIYGNIYDLDLNKMEGRIEVEVDSVLLLLEQVLRLYQGE